MIALVFSACSLCVVAVLCWLGSRKLNKAMDECQASMEDNVARLRRLALRIGVSPEELP